MKLHEIRKRIDSVDAEIYLLILKRMELALKAGRCKKKIYHPERERTILENIKTKDSMLITDKFVDALYSTIFSHSRTLQQRKLTLIGYQGEHGAFSEAAAHQFEESAVAIPHKTFAGVFLNLVQGTLDYGVVPVRNSTTGRIAEPAALLQEHKLPVLREISLLVHQCLLTLPGVALKDIRAVYSHPQALAQCSGFLNARGIEARTHYDTAGAALMLARQRPPYVGAIAARRCARLYGLSVAAEAIQDDASNTTYFAVIAGVKPEEI